MSDLAEKLTRLIDELIKDVLEMTDEEVLAEAEPGDVERLRAIIENAIAKANKGKGEHER